MTLLTGIYTETPLNTNEIPQAQLDIANKVRSNPLKWNGQFSPQLIQVLLKNYATSKSILFDPFLGSGTVLLEAGLSGICAYGTEINPAAIMLAQTYRFINVPIDQRRYHINEVFNRLLIFQNLEWGANTTHTPEYIKSKLVKLPLAANDRLQYQLLETLIALLDFYKADLSTNKVFTVWNKLKKHVLELPFSAQPIRVYHSDARQTPLTDSSINLVITSPPYINVFNYHQQYRASMEALNWNLLQVARSEFGSNRKHRGNRFLTVIQFCLDIAQTLAELKRVACHDSRLIFVVGRESKVRGTTFYNGAIVAEIANKVLDFDLVLRQERMFKNRFGQDIFEDILHFAPSATINPPTQLIEKARQVAFDVLNAGFFTAPEKAKSDLKSALNRLDDVQPSPIFNLPNIL